MSTQLGSLASTSTPSVSGKEDSQANKSIINPVNNRSFSNYNQICPKMVFRIYPLISFVSKIFLLEFPQS